jgi:hypothetical protein
MAGYEVLDEALESMADAGPDLRKAPTKHTSMAIEPLTAVGVAIRSWAGSRVIARIGYRARPTRPDPSRRLALFALRADRFSDWRELFDDELKQKQRGPKF